MPRPPQLWVGDSENRIGVRRERSLNGLLRGRREREQDRRQRREEREECGEWTERERRENWE